MEEGLHKIGKLEPPVNYEIAFSDICILYNDIAIYNHDALYNIMLNISR